MYPYYSFERMDTHLYVSRQATASDRQKHISFLSLYCKKNVVFRTQEKRNTSNLCYQGSCGGGESWASDIAYCRACHWRIWQSHVTGLSWQPSLGFWGHMQKYLQRSILLQILWWATAQKTILRPFHQTCSCCFEQPPWTLMEKQSWRWTMARGWEGKSQL